MTEPKQDDDDLDHVERIELIADILGDDRMEPRDKSTNEGHGDDV